MKTVRELHEAQTEERRSRFLAYLTPYAHFETLREELRSRHPKANHIAYAWRRFNEHGQCEEHSSDDGEPKGCAGMPILNAMRGAELVECALLVVRYFGGIKLGTGGMARAYGAAANSVIREATLHSWVKKEYFVFYSDYRAQRQIHYEFQRLNIKNFRIHYEGGRIRWTLLSTCETIEELNTRLGRVISLF